MRRELTSEGIFCTSNESALMSDTLTLILHPQADQAQMALHDDIYDPSDSGDIVIMLRYCRGEFAVDHHGMLLRCKCVSGRRCHGSFSMIGTSCTSLVHNLAFP